MQTAIYNKARGIKDSKKINELFEIRATTKILIVTQKY